jgi:uncharacterized protein (TIGR02302 family)
MDQASYLTAKIRWQKLAMVVENLWTALQLPLIIVGVASAIFASGILDGFPKWLQLSVLAVLALGLVVSLKDLIKLKAPQTLVALRRMETASAISHRAASSFNDAQVAEENSAQADELWEEHKRRKLLALDEVKIAPPQSAWRFFDPVALRVPVALATLAALLLGPGDVVSNLSNVARLSPPPLIAPLTIDAWLRPPSYTGKAPLLLTSVAMQQKLLDGHEILVPENAVLSLRVQGAEKSQLKFYALGGVISPTTEIKILATKTTISDAGFSGEVKLERPVMIKVLDGDRELASWPISLIPDAPPQISIVGEPTAQDLGKLKADWKTSDDYGVKSITAEISLADEQDGGVGFADNGVFLFDAPEFKIALRKPNAKDEVGSTVQDIANHPWAGLYVTMALTAIDAAGHASTTEPVRFKLPERAFYKPLAAALIEQRKRLILSPDDAPDVATMLDALLAYPYSLRDQSRLVLQLAIIKSHLASAGDTDDVGDAIRDLWPLAIAIEEGEAADVRAELKSLKEQLQQALRDGAPPERIAELTDKMRKAMDKLMEQLRKEGERRKADGDPAGQKNKSISRQELQDMLDKFEKLSKGGDKDSAEQLLSELDKLLQNLQPGGDQADQNGDPALQQKMDELSDLMRKQQELMDGTQRMDPNGTPQQGDEGLADRQGKLNDRLQRLNRDMGGSMQENFGEADKSMKEAEGALRQGTKDDALRQQGEALKDLQKGAQKLGKKLAEQGQGKTGQDGKEGEAGGNNDDPLGRPRATHNPGDAPDKNTVPSELAMRRAREILENLRSRANELNLGETEKAYIERLLKGLH